jgi:putative oxidoreductase
MNQNIDIAALLLRLALGTMFVAHGLLKVMVFTLPGTVGFFEQVGFPGWMACRAPWAFSSRSASRAGWPTS